MGVYIPNMEMPTSCSECKFFAWKHGVGQHCAVDDRITFHATLNGFDVSYERDGNCPLVPVPPHGQDCRTCVQDCQFIGCYMPNILGCSGYIPAEEGEA